jgi:DNA-binding LacI/PurR family transcriptional regulator
VALINENSKNNPTIMDVAKKAFVSKATVSQVINETRFVELETKLRVEQAIAYLGYRPNALATSPTTNRTGTVVIFPLCALKMFVGDTTFLI